MQGDPDITHNARRQRASSPHPFRQSSHIAGVAEDGGGEGDAEERSRRERRRRTWMTQAAASEKFTFNLHLREYRSLIPLTDERNIPLMEAVSGN